MHSLNILITAGPTKEPLDPVRFISNYSTGCMGYAIAEQARKRGHHVTLVSGPVGIDKPKRIRPVYIETAREMFSQVKKHIKKSDCIIMSAAVSDFRPARINIKKIKRNKKYQIIRLVANPDILAWAGAHKESRIVVGFCLETENLLQRARVKKQIKRADFMVANKIYKSHTPFGAGPASFIMLDESNRAIRYCKLSKQKLAVILLDKIEQVWYKKQH